MSSSERTSLTVPDPPPQRGGSGEESILKGSSMTSRGVYAAISYMSCAVLLVLFNKAALSSYSFPCANVNTLFQMTCSCCFLYVLGSLKLISFNSGDTLPLTENSTRFVPLKTVIRTSPLALTYLLYMGSLPVYSTKITVSVVDNVLLIHQVDAKVIILYDIFADSRTPVSAPLPLLIRGLPRGNISSSQLSKKDAESSETTLLNDTSANLYGDEWNFLVPDLVCDVATGFLWKIHLDWRQFLRVALKCRWFWSFCSGGSWKQRRLNIYVWTYFAPSSLSEDPCPLFFGQLTYWSPLSHTRSKPEVTQSPENQNNQQSPVYRKTIPEMNYSRQNHLMSQEHVIVT